MFSKILVPLDGSPGSETALPTVGALAEEHHAKVCLLYVADPVKLAVEARSRPGTYGAEALARAGTGGRALLEKAAERLPGIDVDCEVRFGQPSSVIVEEAKGSQVDAIVMATHRRRGLRRLVEGSVAEEVERRCAIPVVLVPYGQEA